MPPLRRIFDVCVTGHAAGDPEDIRHFWYCVEAGNVAFAMGEALRIFRRRKARGKRESVVVRARVTHVQQKRILDN